jgi:hypothetical protein
LKVGVEGHLLHLRVREFDEYCRSIDFNAGLEIYLFYSALGRRRNPSGNFRHEGAVATNIADHFTAFDGFDYGGGLVDCWRGGF